MVLERWHIQIFVPLETIRSCYTLEVSLIERMNSHLLWASYTHTCIITSMKNKTPLSVSD